MTAPSGVAGAPGASLRHCATIQHESICELVNLVDILFVVLISVQQSFITIDIAAVTYLAEDHGHQIRAFFLKILLNVIENLTLQSIINSACAHVLILFSASGGVTLTRKHFFL